MIFSNCLPIRNSDPNPYCSLESVVQCCRDALCVFTLTIKRSTDHIYMCRERESESAYVFTAKCDVYYLR